MNQIETTTRGYRGRVTRGSLGQENWLGARRNSDIFEKDDFTATVIRKSLRFIVSLSYFLVPPVGNRTPAHKFVSAINLTGPLLAATCDQSDQITAAAPMKFT